ncbi:hypothetical protein G5V58_16500 [Nocardioides anomalus]|uniref:Uncharacterized protein n=1 Tax=Nocardioides anomalus TaxID=2712223 RepID=A0A6G6WG25_9ACTN|nr:hypothetical protein [Nocardioides anomalus]QIG44159.1 hypothetical protein G5V58_16500 [Nocardioides anomalus]
MSPSGVRLLYCGDVQTGARRLRDRGHEVVVLPAAVTVDALVAVAVQEDVDVVAVEDAELGADAAAGLGADVVVFCVTSTTRDSLGAEARD